MRSTNTTYGWIAQSFHWGSALGILLLFAVGTLMVRLGEGDTKTTLYAIHIGLGLLIGLLTIARLIWRVSEPTPASPPGMSQLRRLAFHGVHVLLYALLLLLASSGIGTLLTSGLSVWPGAVEPAAIARNLPPRQGHELVAKVYLVLVAAHVGGALLYQWFKGNVMERMGLLGRTARH